MKLSDNGHPRRMRFDLFTPAERAIWDAVKAVEVSGVHPLLTEAVILLQAARSKVADYVELDDSDGAGVEECGLKTHYGSSAVDQTWRQTLVVGWKRVENGVKKDCWLRWTSPRGLYYWLHPVEGRWVGEPHQRDMPGFTSYEAAWKAYQHVEKPQIDNAV